MADSDDEYDRKRRDKFRGERAEASYRGTERPVRPRDDWSDREAWSRPRPREYRGTMRDRGYSPSIEPQAKRMRHDYYPSDGYYNHYQPYHQPSHREPAASSAAEGTQPPMMSFKAFLAAQDDNISDSEAVEKYNDYKLEFQRQQLNEFFVSHKDDEWFRLKYHPEESVKRKDEQMRALKRRVEVFLELLSSGKVGSTTVDCSNTEDLMKLLDTVVIKLEGGTDADLAILDQEEQDITPEEKKVEQKPKPENGPTMNKPAEKPEEKEAEQIEDAEKQTENEEPKSEHGQDQEDEEEKPKSTPSSPKSDDEKEEVKASEENEETAKEEPESGQIDEDKPEEEIKPEQKDEEEVEKPAAEEEQNNKDDKEENEEKEEGENMDTSTDKPEEEKETTPSEEKEATTEKKSKRSFSGSSSSSSSSSDSETENGEKQEDAKSTASNAEKEEPKEEEKVETVEDEDNTSTSNDKKMEVDNRPRALHRTTSIFLRNLAPTITRQEVEAMCSRYAGFLRVALADPQPERRWLRRGWVTFTRNANIKEICWNLNNIRLRDCELGAIVNRDLSRRIRQVNGITAHKQVVRSDIRISAKVALHLDTKAGLWTESESSQPQQTFGLVSNNPVLHNITDYLIEEASAEEEELLGLESTTDNQDNTNVIVERDDLLISVLDKIIMYLRIVHSVDYYNHCEYPNEDEMPNRCGILHARGPPPLTQTDISAFIGAAVESKMAHFLPEKPKGEEVKNENKLITLALKDVDMEIDKFVQANTRELAKDKWLCPLSGKKFKGPDFVRKHIFNKHGEKIEEVKKEVQFFNNYLKDPKRPMLEAAPVKKEDPPAYNHPPYGSYGGFNGPPRYYNYPRSRGYSRPRGGGGNDFRPVIHYRDLDAPREPEEFI